MRILMGVAKYPPPVVGGLERQAHELAAELVRRGHRVEVVSARFERNQRASEVNEGVIVHRIPWFDWGPARFATQAGSMASILVRLRNQIELVHVHSISGFGLGMVWLAKRLELPVVTKLMNVGEFGVPGIQRRRYGQFRIALLKRSDAIVAMTPESAQELRAIGYPHERVLKVNNGVRPLPGQFAEVPCAEPVTVVFVGRLSAEKGLQILVEAWRVVRAQARVRVRLRIVGDGPERGRLEASVSELGLSEDVEFAGHQPDVPAQLAGAHIFVLPSFREGNSNAILEAMRAGLPIVATWVGGAPIQLGEEARHWLVPPGDPRALADRLSELANDAPLRHRLGALMHSRAESVFSMDQIAATYERAYRYILAGCPAKVGSINSHLFTPAGSPRPLGPGAEEEGREHGMAQPLGLRRPHHQDEGRPDTPGAQV